DCTFFDSVGRKCTIYSVRPGQCRTWPFWSSNMKNRRGWEMSAETCPGMRAPDARGEHFVPVEKIRVIMDSNPDHL
ncbi:MAG: YkgJ family cysteine cluster protein, partial [Phycisphaeraceae bacterium]